MFGYTRHHFESRLQTKMFQTALIWTPLKMAPSNLAPMFTWPRRSVLVYGWNSMLCPLLSLLAWVSGLLHSSISTMLNQVLTTTKSLRHCTAKLLQNAGYWSGLGLGLEVVSICWLAVSIWSHCILNILLQCRDEIIPLLLELLLLREAEDLEEELEDEDRKSVV